MCEGNKMKKNTLKKKERERNMRIWKCWRGDRSERKEKTFEGREARGDYSTRKGMDRKEDETPSK